MNIKSKKFPINLITTIGLIFMIGILSSIGFSNARTLKNEIDELYKISFDSDTITVIKHRNLGEFRNHMIFKIGNNPIFHPAVIQEKIYDINFMQVGDILNKKTNSCEFTLNRNGMIVKYHFYEPAQEINFFEMTLFIFMIFVFFGAIAIYIIPYSLIDTIKKIITVPLKSNNVL